MRDAFAKELALLADTDPRIVLLMGDIGNRLFDPFRNKHPERFFNCGIAEANMTGMAAGLAMNGFKPITYSITPFVTTRCLEQIRLDICYHNLPVIVIGLGAGLAYAGLGGTHQALEDVAFMRALPNMTVVCPGDAVEVRLAFRRALAHDGPVYLRLGKKREPVVHTEEPEFVIGKAIVLSEGSDVCLINTGNLLPVVVEAAKKLAERNISTRVVQMHTVKPLDTELLADAFSRFRLVCTVEEHHRSGGFGGAVAEWLADQPVHRGRLYRFGTPDSFLCGCGSQANARELSGLTPEAIALKISSLLARG